MTKYDVKRRPEVEIKDVDKYEFGGFEIDEQLTNGYNLYVPYGIHRELFEAIKDSIRLMENQRKECECNIAKLSEDMNTLEERLKGVVKYTIGIQQDTIRRVETDLKVLEKFVELENEI